MHMDEAALIGCLIIVNWYMRQVYVKSKGVVKVFVKLYFKRMANIWDLWYVGNWIWIAMNCFSFVFCVDLNIFLSTG